MRAAGDRATIAPSAQAAGRVVVPGDKSISHRYAMLAALADGESVIHGYSRGADCAATLECVRALGVDVQRRGELILIRGLGREGLRRPLAPLDAANSGTTMRLMSGILAGQPFLTQFTGDESLRRRPMRRIIDPLQRMGATVTSADGFPPLTIQGTALKGIIHRSAAPSAQVKSCVLLAGLYAEGTTVVEEPVATRDHTERALETFQLLVVRSHGRVAVEGGQALTARELHVPGDISGAAFWGALAAGMPGGHVVVEHVGLNPTRTDLLDILRRAGAEVMVTPVGVGPTFRSGVTESPVGVGPTFGSGVTDSAEPIGSVVIAHGETASFTIEPGEVPGVIDEIPALAALAAMMPPGRTLTVRGARELRVKESDRIASLAAGFRAMGAQVDEFEDGFRLEARPLHGAMVDAAGDHRLAMAFAIAATRASGPVTILGASAVDVSYPGFFDTLERLTQGGSVGPKVRRPRR
ncbi:MAG TPA: 3-phosphoshikimate 1-carboxyvinyltransferase [Vicinamibacterales bacterium]|nr:3-phosphoshikimate 1-carboxyvinyltransferase [Vicinamibacterales bacterium]